MYIIWKASIEEYRVKNTLTNEIKVLKSFTLIDCSFKVDINLYQKAKDNNFVNSGNPNDFFAWIEAKGIKEGGKPLKRNVFYNPFKSAYFKDRSTNERKDFTKRININGNLLSYE